MRKITFDSPVMRFCGWVGDLFVLSLLWVVTSLPLITVGASSTAAYYVILKKVRREPVPLLRGFFHSFAQNFRQATVLWIIYAALAADVYILLRYACGGALSLSAISANLWLSFAAVAFCLLWVFSFVYAFPMLSLLDMRLSECVRNALMLSFRYFFNTLVILITAVALILLLNQFYWLSAIVIGVIFYVQASLVYKTMLPYLPPVQDGTEEASPAEEAEAADPQE